MLKDKNDFLLEEEQSIKRKNSGMLSKKQLKIAKQVLSGLVIILLVAAWAFIFYKCVDIGKLYFEDMVAEMKFEIEAKNTSNQQAILVENAKLNLDIQALNNELETFKSEVSALNNSIDIFSLEVESLGASIDFIDSSVATSIAVQEDIGNKIQTLNARIEELRNSLNILLEAP